MTVFSNFWLDLAILATIAEAALLVWIGRDVYRKLTNSVSHDPFNPLKAWDPSKPDEHQGLYQKYYVCRVDRSDYPGGKHENCSYYILDLTHDPYALETLHYYARACEKTHPELAKDLKRKVTLAYREMEDRGKI